MHGGRAVVAAMLEALSRLRGLRPAEAGEFTRRAFLNGKMDLVEAEALADLVAAETEAQRRFAVRECRRAQSALYAGWRKRIVHARAMIEAELDFADEGDVPGRSRTRSGRMCGGWSTRSTRMWRRSTGPRSSARAIRSSSLGAPNAGKSSLLNALARRDVAIVTDEPGTTRDLVQWRWISAGVKVDGHRHGRIREAAGKVEAIGIERALESVQRADLVLLLEDMAAPVAVDAGVGCAGTVRIGTKADLVGRAERRSADAMILLCRQDPATALTNC